MRLAEHIGVDRGFFGKPGMGGKSERAFAGPGADIRQRLLDFYAIFIGAQVETIGAELGRDFTAWLEWDGCRRTEAGVVRAV